MTMSLFTMGVGEKRRQLTFALYLRLAFSHAFTRNKKSTAGGGVGVGETIDANGKECARRRCPPGGIFIFSTPIRFVFDTKNELKRIEPEIITKKRTTSIETLSRVSFARTRK